MKYVIVGPALSGNMGAASMVLSTVRDLTARDAQAEVTLLSYYPEEDRALDLPENLSVLDARPVRLGTLINGGSLLWRLAPPLRRIIARRVPEVEVVRAGVVVVARALDHAQADDPVVELDGLLRPAADAGDVMDAARRD